MSCEICLKIGSWEQWIETMEILDGIEQDYYRVEASWREQMDRVSSLGVKAVLERILGLAEDVPAEVRRLRERLKAMRKLSLTVVGRLNLLPEGGVVRWVKENVGEDVMIAVIEDPGIIGGAVVEFEGRRCDLSVAKKVETWWEAKLKT